MTGGARASARAAAVVAGAVGTALLLAAPVAQARLVDARAGVRAGGMAGWGITQNVPDFFSKTRGFGGGFEIGAKLLVIDLSINYMQMLDTSGTAGALTQFLLGVTYDFPVGRRRLRDGGARHVLRPTAGGGFGFGTPGPVSPPLTAKQISDKGMVVHGKFGYEYFLNRFMAVGGEVVLGYHWFIYGANVSTNSSGPHFQALGTFNFHLGI